MDVSNGLGIVKAVSGALSGKVLLVISKGDIDGRMVGTKNLADIVAKLIPNCDVYYKNLAIDPILTHMQFTDGKTLKHLFNLGYKEIEDKGDTVDMALMHIFNTAMKCKKPIILDPLKSDRTNMLERIFDSDNEWIKKQTTEFRLFVTSAPFGKINEQCLKQKPDIVQACLTIDKKEINCSVIDSKLYDLTRLTQVLPDSEKVASTLKEAVRYVADAWNKRHQNATKPLGKTDNVNERSIDDFKTATEMYYQVIEESQKAETLRKKYFLKQNTRPDEDEYDLLSANTLYETLNKIFASLLNDLSLMPDSKKKWLKIEIILSKFGSKFK